VMMEILTGQNQLYIAHRVRWLILSNLFLSFMFT
jgi:hypothetical protein